MCRIQRLQYTYLQIDRALKDIRSLPAKQKLIWKKITPHTFAKINLHISINTIPYI